MRGTLDRDMRTLGDSPPEFAGDFSGFKEWRRRAELWVLSTRAEPEKRGPRLLSQLGNSAWDCCRHLSLDDIAKPEGWNIVFAELDKTFGDTKEVMLVESLEEVFYKTKRFPDQNPVQSQNILDAKNQTLA